MISGTVIIGSGKYAAVAGLSWRPLGMDPRTEITTACENLATKHGILLLDQPDGRPLLGLLPPSAPSKARTLPSAAAWLANACDRTVILIKAIPKTGQFWVVQSGAMQVSFRADHVLPENDAVELIDGLLGDWLHEPDDARPRLIIDGERYPSSHLIERWSSKEFVSFEELVRSTPPQKSQTIRQLAGIKPGQILAIAMIALVVAGAVFGMRAWKQHQQAMEIEQQRLEMERQRLVQEQLKTQAEVRMAQAVVNAMTEDTATPAPDELVTQCVKSLRSVGRELGGWRVSRADCSPAGNALTVDLILDPVEAGGVGTNASLVDAAARRGWKASIDLAAQRAKIAIPLTPPATRTALKPAEAPALEAVQTRFIGRLQLLAQGLGTFSFKVSNLEPRSAVYLDPAKENNNDASRFSPVPPERIYRKGTFDLAGRDLWQATSFSLNYPFVAVEKFEMNITGTDAESIDWTIKGHYVSARL
ncbi:MAG TPA: type 4b pilus protein PilO2 [Rhodanobacteraceae bacterium]|nr:type 4b pilus protein PilO2 [Rhodanobacteraceae bacterium]